MDIFYLVFVILASDMVNQMTLVVLSLKWLSISQVPYYYYYYSYYYYYYYYYHYYYYLIFIFYVLFSAILPKVVVIVIYVELMLMIDELITDNRNVGYFFSLWLSILLGCTWKERWKRMYSSIWQADNCKKACLCSF